MDNVVFMAIEGHKKLTDDTWITDSGATCHIRNNMEGMFDIENVHKSVKIGTGKETCATKFGKFHGEVKTTPEGKKEINLSRVQYIPRFYMKLFSITSSMKNEAKLTSKGMKLTVKKSPVKLKFKK